jgi:hypothetical protein
MINYRILVRDLRSIRGGTSIPAHIPMSFTADQTNVFMGEFQTFKNLKFGKRLNNYGSCSFEIKADDPKASSLISLRKYGVWVYRDDGVNEAVLVWAGEMAAREGNLDNAGNNWVTIHCYDWLEQLNSRFSVYEKIYENTDAGAIAWDLINETQNDTYGDLGIILGEIEETTNRDRTYHNQNIMEAIIALANLSSGFDFEITNDKVFNVKTIIGEDKTDEVVFEYGFNVDSVKILEDFTHPATRAIILGEAIGEDELQRVEVDNSAYQLTYKLREYVFSETEEQELESFTERGLAVLRKYKSPLMKIDIDMIKTTTPNITQFSLGDMVKLKIKSGIYDIDSDYRIFEWDVEFGDDNAEKMSLILGDFITL